MNTYKIFKLSVAISLIAFALLTLFLSSSILFDWFGIREKEGHFVPLVVWSNFIASLLYLIVAYGYILSRTWPFKVILAALIVLLLAFIGLFIHMSSGGLYETRTFAAMTFRIAVTLFFTWIMYRELRKKK
tara:strand:- start:34050 stop:34442 length:393 start_codon:yes stop_codon:yes gene_type:complete